MVYTIVQHSAYGYGHDRQFAKGLETRKVDKNQVALILRNGGLVFPSYQAAEKYAEQEMYPPGTEGLIPCAPGTFFDFYVDDLPVYIPKKPA